MKPITKAEVKKVWGAGVHIYLNSYAHRFMREKTNPKLSAAYWIRLGYEIARIRAKKGEEL
jgi:hypothetical protein